MSGLIRFEDQDKFFIKFFLLDATLNLNKWGVTEKSLRDGLDSFIGKPFVLTADYDHPSASDGDDLLIQQEKYRVGNIIMVGIEERSGKAYGVAEITDKEAIDILKGESVNFVSPSIVFNNADEMDVNGNAVIDSWEGAHVAGVAEPAYTIEKAQIKGKCSGDKETCLSTLNKVQASRSPCGKFTEVTMAGKRIIGQASKCVEDCISKKREHGKEIDDQALAICYSECDESSAAHDPDEQKEAFLSMMYNFIKKWQQRGQPQKANIDQESLDNITKIDLLKKKKKEAQEPEITSKNKKKITMPTKEGKTKEQYEKELEDYELQMQSFSKNKKQNTSVKSKNSKKSNNMKNRYGQEEEKKEDAEDEEEDKKDAQDLSNENEKQHDEEMKKSSAEDKDDKEDAEDEDKLDLTDKQKEFLRDSRLAKQVSILKAEVKALKAHIKTAKLEPIINSIVEAKSKLGKVNAEAEYAKLSKLDSETLESLKADYEQVVATNNSPRYQVKYASVSSDKTGDDFLIGMRGDLA